MDKQTAVMTWRKLWPWLAFLGMYLVVLVELLWLD